ncbi:MAG: V-type ATP synthase subunit D [Thermoplasmata archaeon]|nr:V-type ATP synthase subunit D [Thermoplasmata archaeon]MCI4344302.1 V-type ATP synthase subunit D [Thermoplasmata archaeon]
MPAETIRPTRLELLRTRRRIVVAKRGLNLLKLKRSALIAEFFSLSKEALALRGDLKQRVARGYEAIRMAETMEGPVRLENLAMLLPAILPVNVATKNVMGVKTPRVDAGTYAPVRATALLDLPTSVHEAIRHFQGIYAVVLQIAEKENALRRLLKEIEKTKRRASAIENVLIPRLQDVVRYIKFRFDEMERDAFSMLKTVKRKMQAEEEGASAAV